MDKTMKDIMIIATERANILNNVSRALDAGKKDEVLKAFTETLDAGCVEAYEHGYWKAKYGVLKTGIWMFILTEAGITFYKLYKKGKEATKEVTIEITDEEQD